MEDSGKTKTRNFLWLSKKSLFLGILFNIGTAVSISTSGALIRYTQMGGNICAVISGVMATILSVPFILSLDKDQRSCTILLIAILNGFVVSGLYSLFYLMSLDYITSSETMAVNFFSCFLFSVILEVIVFKVKPHWLTSIPAVIGLAGLFLISRSRNDDPFSFEGYQWTHIPGILYSLAGGFLGGIFHTVIKKFRNVEMILILGFGAVGQCVVPTVQLVIQKYDFSNLELKSCMFMLLASCLFVSASVLAIKGTQLSSPSIGSFVKTSAIVFGYVMELLLFKEHFFIYSVIGCSLVGISIIFYSFIVFKTTPETTAQTSETNQFHMNTTQ